MEGLEAERLFFDHLSRADGVVNTYCRKFHALYPIKEDLQSESRIGLWEACLRFEKTTNNTFWTFAYLRVRGSIVDCARANKIWIRDRELKDGRKNYKVESLNECSLGRGIFSNRDSIDGVYEAFGFRFTLEDKKSDIEINKIHVGRIIDSGTNGMSRDKKEILKKYFCEGVNVPDMNLESGIAKRYAWAAIREGVEELKKQKVFINTGR